MSRLPEAAFEGGDTSLLSILDYVSVFGPNGAGSGLNVFSRIDEIVLLVPECLEGLSSFVRLGAVGIGVAFLYSGAARDDDTLAGSGGVLNRSDQFLGSLSFTSFLFFTWWGGRACEDGNSCSLCI